jgi:hypothetical protein
MTAVKKLLYASSLIGFMALPVAAEPVYVTITGTIEYNQVTAGAFRNTIATVGSAATMTFTLDSNNFLNSMSFPTRAYVIDQPSYQLQLGPAIGGLKNPFPGTPYFVVRNNDPAVDGFFLSTGTDFPAGLELNVTANVAGTRFLRSAFAVTYEATRLPSLDILDAVGSYNFTGLTVFNFVCEDLSFEPIGMVFEQMTIARGLVAVERPTWSALKSLYR